MEGYKINGLDAFLTYGIIFPKGLDKQLLKLPAKKQSIEFSYPDHDGTERGNVDRPFYESATLTIGIVILANNEADFYQKYGAFTTFILNTGYFNFDVTRMKRRFKLLYKEMSDFDKLTSFESNQIGCTATLTLINDFPTSFYPIPS